MQEYALACVGTCACTSTFVCSYDGSFRGGESQDWSVLQVCRIDAGTQTTCERKLSDERRLRDDIAVGSLEDEVLWSRSRNLPACISALAIQGEAAVGAVGSQTHCLRKLEVRVASCWRHSDGQQASSLKGSEHSSLQLSSTQSPSSAQENLCSEGSVGGRHRLQHTPCNSLSSVSSPLENSSLLKDLDAASPAWDRMRDDVAKLPVEDLQRRAEALTQKLQHREHQCMVLREALEACNHHFRHALEPKRGGS
ncbi:unnamed protein product [Symbiodinium natans]|uniref:Uncharacterized protein n=1 Tax=Symbiodinium natans TaxID=878477 RepID=A0A812IHG2_9DINO|nr:unnamed protein product [Symbiodinium natans]